MAKNTIETSEFKLDIKPSKVDALAPWYIQWRKLSDSQRNQIAKKALALLKETKSETFDFIKKFDCKLVGICPRVEYSMIEDGEVHWIHSFSMPTLLYWCPAGEFGLFVNANLKYDDSVLNGIEGNKSDREISGFTG